tara:strand:+ start:467 stop:976 length:510 start_codon:yes stop_codon:yes gene_type:complete
MSSSISHKIKNRKKANDVFITPPALALMCINRHSNNDGDLWLDSCKNSGSFYNQFPTDNKDYCEILEDKDFLQYDKEVDIISQNPPYSILNVWIDKCISITRKEIGLLIGVANLTAKRIETFNKAGFYLKSYIMFKVYKWYGMSCYVIFSTEISENLIDIDRTVWRGVT